MGDDDRDDIRSDAARAAGVPSLGVRGLLARGHVGFTEAARSFERWLLPPPTSVTVILNVGEPFGGLPAGFAAGLDDTFSVVAVGGAVSCVDVKLTPLGAYRVFGRPMGELSGRTVGLGDLVGEPVAAGLLDAFRAAPGWTERFGVLDGFLAERAAVGPAPAPEVTYVWRRLSGAAGPVRVGALAAEVGWSHKHLITQFRRQVGLAPGRVARVARFASLLRRLDHAAGPPRWGDLVEACGYYDQSHLDRDFRRFAGTTPRDFLTRRAGGGSLVGDGLAEVGPVEER